ncbi:MAG TPA: ABC transporter ATP-binding protein [Stellaceae bacterium]|nr:ABC transporter ATP-binding protein [Stellaceae bacterium]
MTNPVIEAEKLTRRLPGEVTVTLVEDASLTVRRGEFVAITGASGSGKSSLLYLLGLLDRPTSGGIRLRGEETSTLEEDELAELRLAELGFVFQFHFLLPEFSALENVMLPMQRLGRLRQSEIEARATELLSSLDLAREAGKLPKQLSGGQSQRVAIARALANDPLLILADEPTGNLDSAASANVQKILEDLAHRYGRAVIVVTHDRDFAAVADRVVVMSDGRIDKSA